MAQEAADSYSSLRKCGERCADMLPCHTHASAALLPTPPDTASPQPQSRAGAPEAQDILVAASRDDPGISTAPQSPENALPADPARLISRTEAGTCTQASLLYHPHAGGVGVACTTRMVAALP